jgi:hypothetical protein
MSATEEERIIAVAEAIGIDDSSVGGAMSAYWFMHDAAALPSLGAKPRTLP